MNSTETWKFEGHILPEVLLLIPKQFCKGEDLVWMDDETTMVIDGDMMPSNWYPENESGDRFHYYRPKIGCPKCQTVLFDYKDAEYVECGQGINYSFGNKIPNYDTETFVVKCPKCNWSHKLLHFSYPGA